MSMIAVCNVAVGVRSRVLWLLVVIGVLLLRPLRSWLVLLLLRRSGMRSAVATVFRCCGVGWR
jgi:hypothetical protein